MENKYLIVTGGGTGGHLSVAKSLIDEFNNRGYKVIFIGSTNGADKRWFEQYDKLEKAYFFNTRGVVNQNLLGKFKSGLLIVQSILLSIKIIYKYKVNKIVSVGGFSAAPASFATIILRRELFIHEQNSIMGSLNRITSKFAKEVFSSYNKDSSIKDYPINKSFFNYLKVRTKIDTVIFLGGSQGARAINNFALEIAPLLEKKGINIIHQTGKNDFKRVQNIYNDMNIKVELFDFSKDILTYMNKADFAISRSGASTLWELSAIGIPSLFIPYPYAASNHQFYNAKFLFDDKLCLLCEQSHLSTNIVDDIINLDINDMSTRLIKTIKKDGIKLIVDKILLG